MPAHSTFGFAGKPEIPADVLPLTGDALYAILMRPINPKLADDQGIAEVFAGWKAAAPERRAEIQKECGQAFAEYGPKLDHFLRSLERSFRRDAERSAKEKENDLMKKLDADIRQS